jgi:hypothetical protein
MAASQQKPNPGWLAGWDVPIESPKSQCVCVEKWKQGNGHRRYVEKRKTKRQCILYERFLYKLSSSL